MLTPLEFQQVVNSISNASKYSVNNRMLVDLEAVVRTLTLFSENGCYVKMDKDGGFSYGFEPPKSSEKK